MFNNNYIVIIVSQASLKLEVASELQVEIWIRLLENILKWVWLGCPLGLVLPGWWMRPLDLSSPSCGLEDAGHTPRTKEQKDRKILQELLYQLWTICHWVCFTIENKTGREFNVLKPLELDLLLAAEYNS